MQSKKKKRNHLCAPMSPFILTISDLCIRCFCALPQPLPSCSLLPGPGSCQFPFWESWGHRACSCVLCSGAVLSPSLDLGFCIRSVPSFLLPTLCLCSLHTPCLLCFPGFLSLSDPCLFLSTESSFASPVVLILMKFLLTQFLFGFCSWHLVLTDLQTLFSIYSEQNKLAMIMVQMLFQQRKE